VSVETGILIFIAIDVVLILLLILAAEGQRAQQRRQEWREIRQPPDIKGPPND
jgi:uncharacterized membrane protein